MGKSTPETNVAAQQTQITFGPLQTNDQFGVGISVTGRSPIPNSGEAHKFPRCPYSESLPEPCPVIDAIVFFGRFSSRNKESTKATAHIVLVTMLAE